MDHSQAYLDRYLVDTTNNDYLKTTVILKDNMIDIVTPMNNYDGTFDYIIKCDELTAQQLRDLGVVLIRDKVIKFDMSL